MKYPLPWCDKLDMPYWKINVIYCVNIPGWRKWQAYKPMSEIIPRIDETIEVSN